MLVTDTPGDTSDLTTWTEVDSGTNISTTASTLTATGTGSWNVNGIISPAFDLSAVDFVEFDWSITAIAGNGCLFSLGTTPTLNVGATTQSYLNPIAGPTMRHNRSSVVATPSSSFSLSTTYTTRFYTKTGDHYGFYVTISGGSEWPSETLLCTPGIYSQDTCDETTAYMHIQISSSSGTLTVSNVRLGGLVNQPTPAGGKSIWMT